MIYEIFDLVPSKSGYIIYVYDNHIRVYDICLSSEVRSPYIMEAERYIGTQFIW
jgi:hypothetical protein